jgi:hypothetical protein
MNHNKKILNGVLPYHRMLLDSTRYYAFENKLVKFPTFLKAFES